jgi:MraZ protein
VLIPDYLMSFAEIKRDVVIVGVSNRMEIWSKEGWLEYFKNTKDSFEKIAEKLYNGGAAGQVEPPAQA